MRKLVMLFLLLVSVGANASRYNYQDSRIQSDATAGMSDTYETHQYNQRNCDSRNGWAC